jgi:FlgD Ig-like domain
MCKHRSIWVIAAIIWLTISVAQAGTSFQGRSITIVPALPTTADSIEIIVCGEWGSSCPKVSYSHAVWGNTILIQGCITPAAQICLTVITSWSIKVPIGKLPAGTYMVDVNIQGGFWSLIDTAVFAVTEKNLTSVQEITDAARESFMLRQNYPNPFNPETEIRFQLPTATHVIVRIFDLLGEEIRTIVNANYAAGLHAVRWDGRDHRGGIMPSGVYFYQMVTPKFSRTMKMILTR